MDEKQLSAESADVCTWEGADGALALSFSAVNDRSLQEYYDTKDTYQTYEELDVAGNPAVIAEDTDATSSCSMWLATKQDQVVNANVFLPNEDIGKVDPCDVSKQMFELSVPSWPAA